LHGDEPRLPAHELDQPYAVASAGGLDLGGQQRTLRLLHGSVESKASAGADGKEVGRMALESPLKGAM
jgi:hypothetical protein